MEYWRVTGLGFSVAVPVLVFETFSLLIWHVERFEISQCMT